MAITINGSGTITGATVGTVLQVVQDTYSTQTTVTNSTFVDTGLSATITPSSSSNKILIIETISDVGKWGANTSLKWKLLRGTTQILASAGDRSIATNDTGELHPGPMTHSYLDSPSTTSSITYKSQFCSNNGGNVRVHFRDTISTLILMEIAG